MTSHVLRGVVLVLVVAVSGLVGCRGGKFRDTPIHLNPNMDLQDKYKPYRKSTFFKDGRAMRTPPVGTVARGKLKADDALWRGKDGQGEYIDKVPFTLTMTDMKRGQDRYNIYCTPCHGMAGYGDGAVTKRAKGMLNATNFHQPRIGKMPLGQIYDVITNGSASKIMYPYRHAIPDPNDRWAIAAYIRALQASQNATRGQIPVAKRSQLDADYQKSKNN